ncbi:unnamed protein product [Ostreobium quekettii]|uniref:WW domain-containing protein n=1 Tax=Ostreobium quekettii TaxID=121088 RepID=A0A8S1JCB2_9CHLO|nr:unnamed protein product [Ostreobium quekettii]
MHIFCQSNAQYALCTSRGVSECEADVGILWALTDPFSSDLSSILLWRTESDAASDQSGDDPDLKSSSLSAPADQPEVGKNDNAGPSLASSKGSDDMDKELASFMEELETSGLLGDEEDVAPAEVAEKAAPAAAEVAAETGDEEPSSTGAGEQRIIGKVEGTEDWHKVLDTASGKMYYWNLATNEVAWEPPPEATVDPPDRPDREVLGEAGVAEDAQGLEQEGMGTGANLTGGDAENVMEDNVAGSDGSGEAGGQDASSGSDGARGEGCDPLSDGHGDSADGGVEEGVEEGEVSVAAPCVSPSQEVWQRLSDAAERTRLAAGAALDSVPAAVRRALQAQIRFEDYAYLSGQVQAWAGGTSDALQAFWAVYEAYLGVCSESAVAQSLQEGPQKSAAAGEEGGEGVEDGELADQESMEVDGMGQAAQVEEMGVADVAADSVYTASHGYEWGQYGYQYAGDASAYHQAYYSIPHHTAGEHVDAGDSEVSQSSRGTSFSKGGQQA